ncbi:berberine bridge enzyme-like 22 [Senna tora]|uniref:Berberine bridge enzyme-like 22 n=1 Tax=Senna tora TaxID=362788 RepID=A0A834XBM9_9FABA|nr:berberine bridge enzyme-like 22 [Senna tora]
MKQWKRNKESTYIAKMGYYYLALYYFTLLSSSSSSSLASSSTPIEKSFRDCMLTQVGDNSTSFETTILNSTSSLYTQVLESSQQNPRWLNSSTKKPLLIVTPLHVSQVQAAIICSRKHELQVRVRSGGHDYEGLSFLCETPFLIIDLIHLRSIEINLDDDDDGTAWVQTGATLGELYYKIAKESEIHGFPGGLCPSVGLGGHISGGGFGTLVRKYGLAADQVIDAYLVDVNGKVLDREKMGEDVFWAIRGGGGGGSFGVILAWKIRLVRVPPIVTVFNIQKTLSEGASKLVHKWQYIANKLHEDLFIRVIAENSGTNPIRTVKASFNSLFLGRTQRLIPLMDEAFPELGLQEKDCTEMGWIESVLYFSGYQKGDPLEVLLNRTTNYKSSFKAKSDFVKEPIPEKGLEGVWEKLVEEEEALALLIMDPFGGKMDEILEFEIPFPHRKGNLYNLQYMVKWEENGIEESKRHVRWMRMLYRYMAPYVSRSPRAAYFNYRDLDLEIELVQDPKEI